MTNASPTPHPPREGQRHTPGRIRFASEANGKPTGVKLVSETGRDIAFVCIRGEPDDEWQGNAARLVDSWNACAGFSSPATDVPRLVEALKAADAAMGMHGPCKNNSCADCRRAGKLIRAALAALLPEVRP